MMFQEIPVSTPTPVVPAGTLSTAMQAKRHRGISDRSIALARVMRKLRQRPLLVLAGPAVTWAGGARWLSIKSSVAIPERKKRPLQIQ
jgi:hypothetical protein